MWARLANLALGIWLMAAPDILAYFGPARINHLTIGPVVASFSIIGMWEVVREVRWINFVLGAWLAVSPLLLAAGDESGTINSIIAGILISVLSLIKGKIRRRYDGGWRMLFGKNRNSRKTDQGNN